MKPSKELSRGVLLGLRAPFGVWLEVAKSSKVDLTPRYTNTVASAWRKTGTFLRYAEAAEGRQIEQAKINKADRLVKEAS